MTASREQLEALLNTDITEPIPASTYGPILTNAPFIPTQSIVNLRDAGAVPGSSLPSGRIYRCGTLEQATSDPDTVAWLQANVKRIFDLRKPAEREKGPDPVIQGIENVWFEGQGAYPYPDVSAFAEEGGRKAWKDQLLAVASIYKKTFRAVLEHVRDRPAEPFLFHCTAGRDRTGVLAGLLQTLAGSPHDAVIFDYMLSRVGIEPARAHLEAYAQSSTGVSSPDTPGFKETVSLKPEYFEALEEGLQEKYGGWEGYVTHEDGLGLTSEDLAQIKQNLRS